MDLQHCHNYAMQLRLEAQPCKACSELELHLFPHWDYAESKCSWSQCKCDASLFNQNSSPIINIPVKVYWKENQDLLQNASLLTSSVLKAYVPRI